MSPRRAYGLALLLLAVGGAVLLFAFGMPWATASVPLVAGSTDAVRAQSFTGRDLFPAAAVSGWVALAGLAGIIATRSWGRIVVALVVLAAGVTAVVAVGMFAVAPSGQVDSAVSAVIGSPVTVASSASAWWLAALGGAMLVLAAGAWTAVRGRRWPALGSRYERTASPTRELSAWEAQDLGQDPTEDLVE